MWREYGALAINPQTPATVYVEGVGGVFKTTNAGASWAAANSGLNNAIPWSLAINPQNLSTVYAGPDGKGVFKTTDAGSNWIAINSGLQTLRFKLAPPLSFLLQLASVVV
jgi:photosystem II stability/assembly factor-like uncharacterized protein